MFNQVYRSVISLRLKDETPGALRNDIGSVMAQIEMQDLQYHKTLWPQQDFYQRSENNTLYS